MKRSTGTGLLAGIGLAVSAAIAVVIGVGHTKKTVEQSQPASWEAACDRPTGWPRVCAEPGVDRRDLEAAVRDWRRLGYALRAPVWREACPRAERGWVSVRVDPALDDAGPLGDDDPTDWGAPSAWDGGRQVLDEARVDELGREALVSSDLALHPEASVDVLRHGLGHSLGFQHPLAPPSGTVMHPRRPGGDLRGLECVSWAGP